MLKPYLDLTKPRLTLMVLATTLLGFYISAEGHALDIPLLMRALVGSALIGGGANAFNQCLEKNIDSKMPRTASRPLPSGKLSLFQAYSFALASSAAGFAILFLWVNPLTAWLGLATLISYVLCYTPLKRVTSLNTLVGAIPGALPPVMGWTAQRNALDWQAAPIFFILFCWQLPHFFIIAWAYREDYRKGGLKMLTVVDPSPERTGWKILVSSILTALVSFLPYWMDQAGSFYLLIASLSGVLLIGSSVWLLLKKLEPAKKFISVSIYYLMILIIGMILDKSL